jgi:glutamate-1-semialdehyde aminotransferase
VRIARAASGKDTVLFCGYHGWSDWYIASNLSSGSNLNDQLLPGLKTRGVPKDLAGTTLPFHYGNLEEFKQRLAANRGKVGVVIMEVQRYKDVDVPFLSEVKRLAHQAGAVLIFDEITSGFRLRAGGLHTLYGVDPDIVVLGKAMGNGFPIAAIVGKKDVMQSAQDTFISSTYWTERVGFTAALEVIRRFKTEPVAKHLSSLGGYFKPAYEKLLRRHGLKASVVGIAPSPHVELDEKDAALLETVFTQEMLKKGFLASNLTYFSYAHTKKVVDSYLAASDEVWGSILRWRSGGQLRKKLVGEVRHSGFKRLT